MGPSLALISFVIFLHFWYKTHTHPAELTAGFYNTINKDGYDVVTEMFVRNSYKMILPGMDPLDVHQLHESLSRPELLLAQIRTSCKKHGVEVSRQNSLVLKAPHHFEQIRKNISGENIVDLFTYQRMDAKFFSLEHFPSFTRFARSLNQLEMHTDYLPEEETQVAESLQPSSKSSIQMQLA